MDLQEPRGQGDAAIMPNGKGQGRQMVPGPQWGHLCYERDLLVGLQTSMGEQSHGQAVAQKAEHLENGFWFHNFHFCFFVPSRDSLSPALPFHKAPSVTIGQSGFLLLATKNPDGYIVFTCLHTLSNVTHATNPMKW